MLNYLFDDNDDGGGDDDDDYDVDNVYEYVSPCSTTHVDLFKSTTCSRVHNVTLRSPDFLIWSPTQEVILSA